MPKWIAITGAGSGIGRAIAEKLAEQNYSLLLLGRHNESLETTRVSLKNLEKHQSISCDIRDRDQINDALRKSGVSSLYALVANAGVGGENHYGEKDRWQEIIDTNLTGTYNTVQECLPLIRNSSQDHRKIVFISSILARLGVPGYSAYCASKAGILGLMRSLAAELAPERILVNAVCPGWVNTEMARQGLKGFAEHLNVSYEEAFRQAMAQVPLGKMSEPQEIANLVAFLVSDSQSSFTGQTIDINNGALMP